MTTKANERFTWAWHDYVIDHGERSLVASADWHAESGTATEQLQKLLNSSFDGATLRERLSASYSITEAGGVAICRFYPRDANDSGRPVDLSIIAEHVRDLVVRSLTRLAIAMRSETQEEFDAAVAELPR